MKTQIINLKTLAWITVTMMTTLFISCEKDDDPFKACRKNPDCEYFTCKVNGKRWEPQCDGGPLFGCTPWDVQYYRNIPALDMYIDDEKSKQSITLLVRDKRLQLGKNNLFTNNFIETSFADGKKNSNCVIYVIDTLKDQSLEIMKIDSIRKFISGNFFFTAKNICGEKVLITEGEFNLPYGF